MTLKFGKYKGQQFENTPNHYQSWLLAQPWFNKPVSLSPMEAISKEMSAVSNSLKGWNGYSAKGAASYNRMFELEKAESDIMYCDCGNLKDPDQKYCGMGCGGQFGF